MLQFVAEQAKPRLKLENGVLQNGVLQPISGAFRSELYLFNRLIGATGQPPTSGPYEYTTKSFPARCCGWWCTGDVTAGPSHRETAHVSDSRSNREHRHPDRTNDPGRSEDLKNRAWA